MDPTDTGNPATETTETNANETDPASWRTGIADEYRSVAEKFTSPADVVKSYAELERKLGGSVTPPGDGAGEDEMNAFYRRIGRPDSADGYDIKPFEGVPEEVHDDPANVEVRNRFLNAAHGAGLTQDQAQAVIDFYYGEVAGAAHAADTAGLEADLRREWGSDYEKNVQYGERAFQAFADPDMTDRLGSVIGDAGLLRMFARIGRQMGEAGAMGMTGGMTGGAAGETRRGNMEKEMHELAGSDDYWTNEAKQRRMSELAGKLAGRHPIPGMPGNRGD